MPLSEMKTVYFGHVYWRLDGSVFSAECRTSPWRGPVAMRCRLQICDTAQRGKAATKTSNTEHRTSKAASA